MQESLYISLLPFKVKLYWNINFTGWHLHECSVFICSFCTIQVQTIEINLPDKEKIVTSNMKCFEVLKFKMNMYRKTQSIDIVTLAGYDPAVYAGQEEAGLLGSWVSLGEQG